MLANDLSVLRSHGHNELEPQAFDARFFATHPYIACARPIRVIPGFGPAFSPDVVAAGAVQLARIFHERVEAGLGRSRRCVRGRG